MIDLDAVRAKLAHYQELFDGDRDVTDTRLLAAADAVVQRVPELADEVADLRALFDLQWTRMGEATARWRAEDPEARALVMPDLGDLLQWLMGEADRSRAGGWYLGRCGNEREPDGELCTAELYVATRTDVQVQCPECGAWTGVGAPGRPGRPVWEATAAGSAAAEVERLRSALRLCEHVLHRAEPTDAQIHAAQQASGAYDTDWTIGDVEDDLVPGYVLGDGEIDWADVDWADELGPGGAR